MKAKGRGNVSTRYQGESLGDSPFTVVPDGDEDGSREEALETWRRISSALPKITHENEGRADEIRYHDSVIRAFITGRVEGWAGEGTTTCGGKNLEFESLKAIIKNL